MADDQTERFHHAMLEIYDAAAQLKPPYRASRFKLMKNERGGKAAADSLLAKDIVSNGVTELFLRGKANLKLSVEYLVLKPEWRDVHRGAASHCPQAPDRRGMPAVCVGEGFPGPGLSPGGGGGNGKHDSACVPSEREPTPSPCAS